MIRRLVVDHGAQSFCDTFYQPRQMGDQIVLLVDQLLNESDLQVQKMDFSELVECRICQDDDLISNLESPCSCRGSLKYAHRRCVQRWCDEKGDTVCEICLQLFKPDYTSPPLFHCGSSPMIFRGNWEISPRNIRNPIMIADMNSRSLAYCRGVAMIFTVLVVLRHALPFLVDDGDEGNFSAAESTMLLLRIIGIVLPALVVARVLAAIEHRRRFLRESDEQRQLEATPP